MAATLASLGVRAGATSDSTYTNVLFAGHGVAIVLALDESTGCNGVYLSTDLVRWRNVTPRLSEKVACLYEWASASFVSPDDGWLLARNGGSTTTILEHTTNGGRTWQRQPGSDTGSNGGSELIDFNNARLGWRQQFADGSNDPFVLQRTTDGGASWMAIARTPASAGCVFLPDVFAKASIGFAALALDGSSRSGLNLPYVWRTLDGGVTWTKVTLRRPASVPPYAHAIYGEPTFDGPHGVMPVDYLTGTDQDVVVYRTSSSGLTWSAPTGNGSVFVVPSAVTVSDALANQSCGGFGSTTKGPLVSIGVASTTNWWVLRPSVKGASEIFDVTDAGKVSSLLPALGIPALPESATLEPLSAQSGLMSVPGAQGTSVYVKTSSDTAWVRLSPLPKGASTAT